MTTPPWHNQNVAQDNAHVDQQNGINFGDTTYHRNEYSYHINQGDPPERKHEVALKHLNAGMPRRAEELFSDLIRNGHGTTERAYYFALATLSGRSHDEIDRVVYRNYSDANRVAREFAYDEWKAALDVVNRVMWAAQKQGDKSFNDSDMLVVLDAVELLPEQRQGEITRHLDRLLTGAVQDRLDHRDTQRVVVQRMDHDRAGRAWKFFEPDPAAPRLYDPPRNLVDGKVVARAWAGGLAMLAGLLMFAAGPANVAGVLIGLAFAAVGGYLAVQYGAEQARTAYRIRRNAWQHSHPAVQPVSPGHWVTTAFVQEIHERVDGGFRQARPHVAGAWEQDTRGFRYYLKDRLVTLYGNAQVEPEAVGWLIRWHAGRIATQWSAGTLMQMWTVAPTPTQTKALRWIGVVTAGIGLLTISVAGAFGAALLLGVGGYFTALGMVETLAAGRDDQAAKDAEDRLFKQEQQAHADWLRLLSDRPKDEEMGRWLDLDKAYLKRVALERCGLTNNDLVTYVVMTQGAKDARRARVSRAPVRYSVYVVLVFLLTRSGVREIEVDLDFLTGRVHDERRTAFRYNALASARVTEIGVREANDLGYGAQGTEPLEHVRLRSREFRLSLVNGEDIRVKVENFRGLTDFSVEEEADLLRMALQASGIAGAIHVLEAVAAEGGDWITRERERRQRRAQDWSEYEDEPKP